MAVRGFSIAVMNKIAFLGLGRMGLPMARRLVSAGFPVTVWNRDPAKAQGLNAAASPAEAVSGADLVITMLSDPAAVADVVGRFASALAPGTIWIDMSTIGPDSLAAVAKTLPEGVAVIDAPAMGSVTPAASGDLVILAGGNEEDLAAASPVLAELGHVFPAGGPGSGAALKLVLISAAIGGVALIAEALALADALGLDEQLTVRALQAGPLAGAVARTQADDADFPVGLALKDLTLAGGGRVLHAVRDLLESHPDIAQRDLRALVDAVRR